MKKRPSAPLPMRDGVAPSRVYLPPGPWATVLNFLIERFRFIEPQVLRSRLDLGVIVDEAGVPQGADTPYRPRQWLWYYREVPDEAVVPFELDILHMDRHLVVADKPHFLATTPGGRYLHETALTRLRKQLDLPELSPIHRLDRETAGVMLFCVNVAGRGAYQTLFQNRQVTKEYEAIAPWRDDLVFPLMHRSRLQDGASSFTVQEVPGEPNSETRIEVMERMDSLARYRLLPSTGRKHQLRVHLSALGIPICNDLFYPHLQARHDVDDYERPLQLLARAIEFIDPISGQERRFESRRVLARIP
jgi:tRNA pseudouridine32 synthase/23S rRNA pseudouridine746 synthase